MLAGLDDRGQGLGQLLGVVEAQVAQRDVAAHRLQRDPQPGGVAQRAEGVGERREQVGVLVVGPGGDHLAGAGEDVELEDGVVRQPAAEARRLDAQPGDRAAEGDGAQLRHDQRDQPVRQRRVDEVLVGAHALHVGGPPRDVDRDHAVEARHVQPGCAGGDPRPEQVGRLLGQPHRRARRDRGVRRTQPRDGRLMLGHPPHRSHPHKLPPTAVGRLRRWSSAGSDPTVRRRGGVRRGPRGRRPRPGRRRPPRRPRR